MHKFEYDLHMTKKTALSNEPLMKKLGLQNMVVLMHPQNSMFHQKSESKKFCKTIEFINIAKRIRVVFQLYKEKWNVTIIQCYNQILQKNFKKFKF